MQLLNPTGVTSYCDRVARTIKELEDAYDEEWSEQRQISAYIHGLGQRFDSVREWVAIQELSDLTLSSVLRRLEVKGDALVAKEKRDRARSARTHTGGGHTHAVRQATVAATRGVVQCYRCGEQGHMARECLRTENVCFQCKQPGHIKRDCPARSGATLQQATAVQAKEVEEVEETVFAVEVRESREALTLMRQHGAWLVDSGASCTMTGERHLFHGELQPFAGRVQVAKAGAHLPIRGIGIIRVHMVSDEGAQAVLEVQALYVPGLMNNLLATNSVVEQGGRVVLSAEPYIEMEASSFPCERHGNQTLLVPTESACITQALLHRRMAHSDRQRCTKLAERLGMSVTERNTDVCEPCTEGNLRRAPFPKQSETAVEHALQYVAVDTQGPLPCSIDGVEYIIMYVDYATDYAFDYYLHRKSEAVMTIDKFVRDAGGVPKRLRTDGAGDLCNGEALRRWTQLRVPLDRTARASPQQNGRVERKLSVVTEHIRAMLLDAQLPEAFWSFAARTACMMLNIFLTSALDRDDTPYKRFTGRDPDLSRLRVFGCKAWVHDPRAKMKGKLQPRASPAVFVGYQKGMKGWCFYLPETGAVVNSREARFLEDVPGGTIVRELPRS